MKKKVLFMVTLIMALGMFSFTVMAADVTPSAGDPVGTLRLRLLEKYPGEEAVRRQYGPVGSWTFSYAPNRHDPASQNKHSTMVIPGSLEIDIFVNDDNGLFFLTRVEVADEGFVNFLGIDIGSAGEDVIKAFGTPVRAGGNELYYEDPESGYTDVTFTIENNKVTKMVYEATLD